jgi:Carbohydrate binding module (family 6)
VPNTGGWQHWTDILATVTLPAGAHRLRVSLDTPGASGAVGNLNYLAFAPTMPYLGIAATIPGTIQAVNFDEGGPNVSYYDLSPGNDGGAYRNTDVDIEKTSYFDGYNVGWMFPGEWLAYTVNIAASGPYRLDAFVASEGPGGTFHLELDRVDITGPLTIPNTSNWQWWTDIFTTVTLPAGAHLLRVVLDTPGASGAVGNLKSLTFTSVP